MTNTGGKPQLPSFLASEFPTASREQSRFHLFPVPWEETVSYKGGTGFGPKAILEASDQLEAEVGTTLPALIPGSEGIYTHPQLDPSQGRESLFTELEREVEKSALLGTAVPVILGGEHSVSYPAIRGLLKAFRKVKRSSENILPPLGVVQFDAHADLRDAYQGNPYSHASVMRRIHQDLGLPIFQIGVRALCEEEMTYRHSNTIPHIDARELERANLRSLELPANFPDQIYITFDVDALDPSIMPSTGTPVPGGLSWYHALDLIDSVTSQRQLVGFDVVELAPLEGNHGADFLAAQLVYYMMGRCVPALDLKSKPIL